MVEADDYSYLGDLQSLSHSPKPSISLLRFPFSLKPDQIKAVNSWVENNFRGTVLYSTGTGKTEIAFECAKVRANYTQPCDTQSFSTYNTDTIQKYHESSAKEDYDNSFNVLKNPESDPSITPIISFFNILFLVPRISLIGQTITRLITYGIPREKIGAYFGERKETREITISTYHSIIKNLNLVRHSNMVIFDEVHLIKDTAKSFSKIFDVVVEDPTKAILGLTATLDEKDFKNKTILAVLPPVIRYSINKAVNDKRLAKPIVIPIKVNLTQKEEKENFY